MVSSRIVFVADSLNYPIRRIMPSGNTTTFLGQGVPGLLDGTGINAMLNKPFALEINRYGTLLIVDFNNFYIREATPKHSRRKRFDRFR